jgi:putative chitinase
MAALNAELLRNIAPHNTGARGAGQAAIIDAIGPVLQATLSGFQIDPPLRAAHFLAQACHESDGFVTTIEYASGAAYEGRADLGNTQPGDGVRFKGRGLIQLTGRTNYAAYGPLVGLDLIAHPEQAAEPVAALKLACEFWNRHGLSALAELDDVVTITRRINGGLNGLDNRQECLAKAKAALGIAGAAVAARPVLQRGATGDAVRTLQTLLNRRGIACGVDGDFGQDTEAAVKRFQQGANLAADGVVGAQTWAALG